MILHAASIAAFFVDQLTFEPVMDQCAHFAPESEWKWWMKLFAEILGPLLSTSGSIYVAWRVFRWQGKKDHEQWVRDQRVAEWRSLIIESKETISKIHNLLAKCQPPRPFHVIPPEVLITINNEFSDVLACGRKLLQGQIFIKQNLADARLFELWKKSPRFSRSCQSEFHSFAIIVE